MQSLLPMLAFAFATSITPGPNNTLLMITCANWGFRASLPTILGVIIGFQILLLGVGVGLGGIFAAWPLLHTILKWVCFAWLLVLAWKIARAGSPVVEGAEKTRPLSFPLIAAFQWVNPKAWMMAVGAMALYVPVVAPAGAESSVPLLPVLRVMAAYFLAGTPCLLAWCLFGIAMARFLTSPRRVAVFNVTMAVLLVLSMIPTLI
jgi:threonine/homoserine/homoserine lactone efflux protein